MTPFYHHANDDDDDDHHDDDDTGTTIDIVSIIKATYDSRRGLLIVDATSSRQPNVMLDVVGYGTMAWLSQKNQYRYSSRDVSDPSSSVTVTSSLGGSDTATVQSRKSRRKR